jgi:hypothetical protein
MKALLIVAALNMQMTYDDMSVCKQAQAELTKNSIESICLPKGKDTRTDDMFSTFMEMIVEIQKLQAEGKLDK